MHFKQETVKLNVEVKVNVQFTANLYVSNKMELKYKYEREFGCFSLLLMQVEK